MGGSVNIVARSRLRSLAEFERISRIAAEPGAGGGGGERTGKSGGGKSLEVPVGTVIWQLTEDGGQKWLGDLTVADDGLVVALGGGGGRGNKRFLTATNQEPLLAEGGLEGEELNLLLEVKLLADVALVGAPNAGKSTLLSHVSKAKPKIADYPFTTLEPILGVVEHRGAALVMLDIPGLIEGAHEGKGLGLEFLRHAERVHVLVQLIDGLEEDLVGAYQEIAKELEAYGHGLKEKAQLVVVNKMDVPEVQQRFADQVDALRTLSGHEPLAISAVSGEGLPALLSALMVITPSEEERRDKTKPEMKSRERISPPVARVTISKEDGDVVVGCLAAERVAEVIDLHNWRTRMQFHQYLRRLNVIRAVENEGVIPGDTVRIGKIILEWE